MTFTNVTTSLNVSVLVLSNAASTPLTTCNVCEVEGLRPEYEKSTAYVAEP